MIPSDVLSEMRVCCLSCRICFLPPLHGDLHLALSLATKYKTVEGIFEEKKKTEIGFD